MKAKSSSSIRIFCMPTLIAIGPYSSKVSIDSPHGLLSASVSKKPWFPAEIKIPKDDFI